MNLQKTPKTWEELDKLLWMKSREKTGEFRPYVAFRGQDKLYDDELKTRIQRLKSGKGCSSLEIKERRILEAFATYARQDLPQEPTDWDVLLLGAHYRLPTRLLDWTLSPYVALFFVTENAEAFNEDGVVWCVERVSTNSLLPEPFSDILQKQSGHMFLLETLHKHFRKGLSVFDNESHDALIWFEPPSRSQRIVNQYACFSLMPGVENYQHEWLKKHENFYWRVPVPAALKPIVRRRLQVMNITERMIYPGLDGIASWLRAYYDHP